MRSKVLLRWVGVAGALALLAVVPAGHARSRGPRRIWQRPVLVSDSLAQRETSLALDPTNKKNLFICDPSGVPNTPYDQSYFHASTDGGKHWSFMRVETSLTDSRTYAYEGGDCDVAYDSAGTMYTADTWLGDLSIGHSTNGGKDWSGTSLAASSPIVDRPWLVGGHEGELYVTYQDLQCCSPSAIWFTKSTDYGRTFTPAVPVTTFAGMAPDATEGPDGAFTWEGNFVVDQKDPNNLYLVYTRRVGPALSTEGGAEAVRVAASHDGGTTWQSHLVTKTTSPASYLYPSIAMDGGGGLHVVYSSAGKSDHPIWYSYSSDKGEKWSAPIPLLSGVAGYSPWVAAGPQPGAAAVAWYGSPDPAANTSTNDAKWFFYSARVSHVNGKAVVSEAGPTTRRPIFVGRQSETPEFEMVRLDRSGNMHIGMSAYRKEGSSIAWAVYYQRQARR